MSTCFVPNGRRPLTLRRCRGRGSPRGRRRRRLASPPTGTGGGHGDDYGGTGTQGTGDLLPGVGTSGTRPSSQPPARESSALLRLPLPRKQAVPRRPQRRHRTPSPAQAAPDSPSRHAAGGGGARAGALGGGAEKVRRMHTGHVSLAPLPEGTSGEHKASATPSSPGNRSLNFSLGTSMLAAGKTLTGLLDGRIGTDTSPRVDNQQSSPLMGAQALSLLRQPTQGRQMTSCSGTMLARVLLGGGQPQSPGSPGDDPLTPAFSPPEGAGAFSSQSRDLMRLPSLKRAGNVVAAVRRLSRAMSTTPPPTLPFSEEEYTMMKRQFEMMDTDGTGDLTWTELQSMSAQTGIFVDYKTFKQMDKDRSGTVDFEEMLRMFYPRARKGDIKWANRNWGEPGDERKAIEGKDKEKHVDWREGYDEDSLRELRDIFALFCHGDGAAADGDHNPASYFAAVRAAADGSAEEGRLTRGQLGVMLEHNPWITTEDIDRLFELHGKTQDATLSFEEFAEVMDAAFPRDSAGRKKGRVQYSFVEPPKPAPQL